MITFFVLKGQKDENYFNQHPVSSFWSHPAFIRCSKKNYELFGLHPEAEYSRTLLIYLDEQQRQVASYERSALGSLVAVLKFKDEEYKIKYPSSMEYKTQLVNSKNEILATVAASSMGSSRSTVTLKNECAVTLKKEKLYFELRCANGPIPLGI